MSTVLVTGASGFVGRALCQRLLAETDYHLIATVRTPIAYPLTHERLSWLSIGDLANPIDWAPILAGVDTVFHLAAKVHAFDEATAATEYDLINHQATARLAKACVLAGVKRFIFMSTIKVNGEFASADCPFTEKDTPAPVGAYAVSKWRAECALETIAKQSGLSLTILRPPLIYGEGVGANFQKLARLVKRRAPLPFSRIKNARSLLSLSNLTELLVSLMSTPCCGTFCVNDGEPLSISALIRCLAKSQSVQPRLIPLPLWILKGAARLLRREDELLRLTGSLVSDSTHLQATLGWAPKQGSAEAIAEHHWEAAG